MQKVRFLFYKPEFGDGHTIDNAIDLWTTLWNPGVWDKQYLRCSHAEAWEPYKRCFTVEEFRYMHGHEESWMEGKQFIGRCYTSTMGQAGGKNREGDGVVVRSASVILDKHPNRWYYYEYEVEKHYAVGATLWANEWAIYNPGYGKMEIASFFLPFRINTKRFICSEFVNFYAYMCNLPCGNTKVTSPIRLSLKMHKDGAEAIDLEKEVSLRMLELAA